MRRGVLILALAGLVSCEFAQKHPGITVGITSGTIGFGTCAINVEKLGTCSIIGGGIGVVLGGITALVTLLANTNAPPDPADQEGAIETGTEPPPGLPDGGLPFTPPPDAGVADATLSDAV